VADQLRTDSRRDALAERLAEREPGYPPDPADQVAQREAALTALARLGERDRELLTLLAWHGLTAAQAAEVLGLTSLTLAVRLHRARCRLASALAVADAEHDPAAARASHAATPASPQRAGRHADARANRA